MKQLRLEFLVTVALQCLISNLGWNSWGRLNQNAPLIEVEPVVEFAGDVRIHSESAGPVQYLGALQKALPVFLEKRCSSHARSPKLCPREASLIPQRIVR